MKKIGFFISLFVLGSFVQSTIQLSCETCAPRATNQFLDQLLPGQGCSVLYATDGEHMLGGNNEDYFNPLTKVWFIPGKDGSFGRVYFGFQDYHPQGGMNDQGLFFDALDINDIYSIPTTGKQEYLGILTDKIMSECATVACALGIFEQYYSVEVWTWQFFFGDASGESAIIEPQAVIRQRGGYQAATNFLQSTISPEAITDPRYIAALAGLKSMNDLTVDAMTAILDEVHLEGSAHTLYSNVYDLNNKIVFLYYFHDYEHVVVLNLGEELAKGYHAYDLPSLFSPIEQAETWAARSLEQYNDLIDSNLDRALPSETLQAYAGEYEMLEGWGEPDQTLTVVAQDLSLFIRFPDYRQHEIFPSSATDFFYITFMESGFTVAYDVQFGLSDDREILYSELILGNQTYRANRIGPKAYLPPIPQSVTATSADGMSSESHMLTPAALVQPDTGSLPTDIQSTTIDRLDEEDHSWILILAALVVITAFCALFFIRKRH